MKYKTIMFSLFVDIVQFTLSNLSQIRSKSSYNTYSTTILQCHKRRWMSDISSLSFYRRILRTRFFLLCLYNIYHNI